MKSRLVDILRRNPRGLPLFWVQVRFREKFEIALGDAIQREDPSMTVLSVLTSLPNVAVDRSRALFRLPGVTVGPLLASTTTRPSAVGGRLLALLPSGRPGVTASVLGTRYFERYGKSLRDDLADSDSGGATPLDVLLALPGVDVDLSRVMFRYFSTESDTPPGCHLDAGAAVFVPAIRRTAVQLQ